MDFSRALIALEWADFDVTSFIDDKIQNHLDPLKNDQDFKHKIGSADQFAFGLMIYQIIFGDIGQNWVSSYATPKSDLHDRIMRLLTPNDMQPLSTVAYHFIVNEKLFPEEKRWSYEEAFHYLKEHPILKSKLGDLPEW